MAITGTKIENNGSSNKGYFVNKCRIVGAEQLESQYSDTSIKLTLEDDRNQFQYTCFINQNYEKDTNGVVTGLKFPDNLNTLYLAAKKDLNVSDVGEANLAELANAQVACISYESTGKYKRAIWSTMSSWEDTDKLEAKFAEQVEKGYPSNFKKPESPKVMVGNEAVKVDDLPF
tara:strand:- start:21005 stop:21526 length:522 start_codon:yes stop_codon:yes gene_type:complete